MSPGAVRLRPGFAASLARRALAGLCRASPEPAATAIRSLATDLPHAAEWGAVSYIDSADGKGPFLEEAYQASVAVNRKHGAVKLRLHVRCVAGCGTGTCMLTCLADVSGQRSGVRLLDFCFDYVNDVLQTADVDEPALSAVGAALLGEDRDDSMVMQVLWRLLSAPLLARPHASELPFGTEITFSGLGLVFTVLHGRLNGTAKHSGSFKLQPAEDRELKILSRFLTGPP